MKRLLLLLPLLLLAACKPAEPTKPTPQPETEPEKVQAAKPVDYVRCDAIANAGRRVMKRHTDIKVRIAEFELDGSSEAYDKALRDPRVEKVWDQWLGLKKEFEESGCL